MGKKAPPKGELEGSPRKSKSPRLDLLVPAAAAPVPEASDPMEVDAAGTSGNNRCNHVLTDIDRKRLGVSMLSKQKAGTCSGCRHEDAKGARKNRPEESSILMCVECNRHLCCGVGAIGYPFGHSRAHAMKQQHWVAVLYDDAERGYCFNCNAEVEMPVEFEVDGNVIGINVIRNVVSWLPDTEGRLRARMILLRTHPQFSGVTGHTWSMLEGIGNKNRCNHISTDNALKGILSSLMLSDKARKCDDRGCKSSSTTLVCLECGKQYCTEDWLSYPPNGHARDHARQKQHWVAVLLGDPKSGLCFKCETDVDVNPEVMEMMGKLQAEGRASGFGVLPRPVFGLLDPRGKRHSHEFGSANMQDYAIRGIPNIANTCYMNAILQCFLALDKLRARLLAPDDRGLYASALAELFGETSAAGGLLNPQKIRTCVCLHYKEFRGSFMHDSHELLSRLREGLNEEEMKIKNLESQIGAPTVIDSIFGFELSEILSCCKCGYNSVSHPFFNDLSLPLSLPSKRHPTKSASSPQTSQSLKSRPKNIAVQLFPANEQSNFEKMQTVAESDYSHLLAKPLEVDSTEAQRICRNKYVVQDPLQTEKNKISGFEFPGRFIDVPVKSVNFLPHNVSATKAVETNEMATDSVLSIEDCLSSFSEEVIKWRCDKCTEEMQMARSSDEDTIVFGNQTEQSDRTMCPNEQSSQPSSLPVECKSSSRQPQVSGAESQIIQTLDRITEGRSSGLSYEKDSAACSITNKEPEFDEGILQAEKQTDLLRIKHSVSKQLQMYQDTVNQLELYSSACQLKDGKNEEKHKDGDAIKTNLFNKLPPVLTLHLKRAGTDHNYGLKNCEQVRFKEYLDVGRFMDPSSVDKDNSLYRLAGVVEHRGTESLLTGHYVAYVRAKRLGNQQQQSSCSSSWFCANDSIISQVTLEEVLKREAYILFYERVEGQDMPGIGSHN